MSLSSDHLVQLSLEMPMRGGGSGAGKNIQTLGNYLKRILAGSPHGVKFFPI